MQLLTPTRLGAFYACQRKHHNLYTLGIEPTQQGSSARFGALYRAGLTAWWRAEGDLDAALDAIATEAHGHDDGDVYELARVTELMRAYHQRWRGELQTLDRIVGVELSFRIPLTHPITGEPSPDFELGGRMDALVVQDGRVFVIQHKHTTQDVAPGSAYWESRRFNLQAFMYIVGATALVDAPVEGCLYDVSVRPQQRPLLATPVEKRRYRKSDGQLDKRQRGEDERLDAYASRVGDALASAHDRHFVRQIIEAKPEQLAAHRRDVWAIAAQLRDATDSDYAVRNPTACQHFSNVCGFLPACAGEADLTDEALFRQRRGERAAA